MMILQGRCHFLVLAFISIAAGASVAQSVEPSDINIGLRADDNVLDVQTQAKGIQEESAGRISAFLQEEVVLTAAIQNIKLGQTPTSATQNKLQMMGLPKKPQSTEAFDDRLAEIKQEIADLRLGLHLGKKQEGPVIKTLTRYTFTNNNSFIGKGVLATNAFDNGVDIQLPEGTEISPYFTYAHGADKAAGAKTGTNLVGGTLSLNQKLLPLIKDYPKAYLVLSDKLGANYPGIDLLAGTDFTFGNTNKYTYKNGAGSGINQDGWTVTPNVTFDLYFNKVFSIALVPSYTYGLTTTDNGLSGSNGVFQFQDRNSFILASKADPDGTIISALQVYETNSLERDVNLEPQPPTTADGYQTWAKFGAGINMVFARKYSFAAQYTYEAFNTSYQAHYVTASFNYQF